MTDASTRQLERHALDGDEDARLRLWHQQRREGKGRDPRCKPLPGDVVGGREVVGCEATALWGLPTRCWKAWESYHLRDKPACDDVHWRLASEETPARKHSHGTCSRDTWEALAKGREVTALAPVE